MTDSDYLDDKTVRRLFNKLCGKFEFGCISEDEKTINFRVSFAEVLREAYREGWHQGWKDAPSDED